MIDSFPPDLAAFVHNEVATGKYPSENALVIAAVELLRETEQDEEMLQQEIQVGIAEIERGECTRYDQATSHLLLEEIKSEGRRLLAAQLDARK